jgi:hypothetical protein
MKMKIWKVNQRRAITGKTSTVGMAKIRSGAEVGLQALHPNLMGKFAVWKRHPCP